MTTIAATKVIPVKQIVPKESTDKDNDFLYSAPLTNNYLDTIGHYHSFESCGTVDGPGIRFIIFMQGCLMRCKYCHNRDTWDIGDGKTITVRDLIKEVICYRHFINASGGGVTASGGEAMLQPEFIRDFFTAAHKENIHTCLDTNGHIRKYTAVIDQVLDVTDLVMLDLKQINDTIHQDLTGVSNKRTLEFAHYLHQRKQKTWIRYVIVPGYTDDVQSAHELGQFIQHMDNIERVELLPYHKLGAYKWETLGLKYPLDGVAPPSKEKMAEIKMILAQYHNNIA